MREMPEPVGPRLGLGSTAPRGQLGAFLGVFTPTILTILGVIMYLRFGWVVGQVGLWPTLLIVALANLITLVTAFSLSAIATNTRIGVGGAYFMISRSLGLEIGGAIGLPLFLSQALSVTLYSFGLAESFRIVWPEIPVSLAAFVIVLLVAGLSLKGADFALRLQLPVMALIGLSVLMLAGGAIGQPQVSVNPETVPDLMSPVGFWVVFAVFFPAVTGIMAGLSLSGDLEDPRRAIPLGSVAATLVGFGVYLLVPVLLSLGADRTTLLSDPLVWTRIAWLGPWLILPGLWGAIFSSAVGSMLGAPRTLQALATDRLVPGVLADSARSGEELRLGLLVTLGLSLAAVFLGDLNRVATVATMFFLSVYGTVNLVAALEELSGNPSWRPTLRIPWPVGLLGAACCFGVMVLIHWPATVIALSVELLIWLVLKRRARREAWGDVRRDLLEAVIRWALVKLAGMPMTARNWRPHMLVFVGNVERRLDLVRFGAWFCENRGVVSVCELLQGDILELDLDTRAREQTINEILRRERLIAFGEVNVVQDLERGILAVAQADGLAGVESNTILVGWPDEEARLIGFLRVIRRLKRLNRSLIIGNIKPERQDRRGRRPQVHIWWGGLKRNGDLMLLLAYLLTRNPEWREAQIRVLSIASTPLMKGQTERYLAELIPEIRIRAEVDVMLKEGEESVMDIMHRKSAGADVVLLGLATPEPGDEERYAERLKEMVEGMPTCFFIHNGSLFIGDLVTPEKVPTPGGQAEETADDV